MVFGILSLVATVPLLATSTVQLQETARNQTTQAEEDGIKTDKCHFSVRATERMSDLRKEQIANTILVLQDGRVRLHDRKFKDYHPVTAYFLPFPDKPYEGVVTTIDEMNMLNWIYIDSDTYEVKYGVRKVAERHIAGPMDLPGTADGERRLTCFGWEGFVAVHVANGHWALYFDKDDDGLRGKLGTEVRPPVVEIEITRMPLDQYNPTETSNRDEEEEVD